MSCVKDCLKVDLETTKKTYRGIEGTFKRLENAMPQAEKLVLDPQGPYNLFPEFQKFKRAVELRVQKPNSVLQDIEKEYAEIVKSYGEEPEKMPMADFFGVFVHLIEELKRAHEANEKRKQDEARAAARGAAGKPVRGGAGPQLGAGDAQRGVLDELMKTLQAGPAQLRKVEPRGPTPMAANPNDFAAAFAKVKKT